MELINNTTKTLKNDLSVEIKQGSKLSIAAACFSIYAFQELKEQLSQIEQLRFIFTSPTFVTEKAKKERREFYIPRLTRERSLYGTEFEIKLRNELTQKAIARECAEWIRQKVTFKSNVSDKSIQGQIVVDSVGYTPINNFTTVELGCEKGNVISTTIVKDESLARTLLADFNEIWNDSKVLQVVTDEVIDSITAAYNENSPDFIYFVTLYNIFNEFLEDVSEDVLPNEATGFKESKIWGMLYNFQKDAALAIINKLEKYNGCILADSVGLGKTFTALAVIKYYENRNKSVLVLCPKKLTNKRYAPFIAKEIFESYKELGRQAYSIISLLDLWSRFETQNYIINYNGTAYTRDKAKDEIETKQKIISKLSDDILDKLRDYLSSLDTLEDKVNG